MKVTLLYVFVFLYFFTFHAQENKIIDSLKSVLKQEITEKQTVETLNELAWEIAFSFPENGLEYAHQALKLSIKNNFKEEKATAYNRLGLNHEVKGELDSSIFYYQLSYNKRIELEQFVGAANVLLNIGAAYFIQGYYTLALQNYIECAELLEKKSNDSENATLSKVYNNIGLVYRTKSEFTEAINWYKKSLKIKRKINDEKGISNTFLNLSLSYQNLKKYSLAEGYLDSTLTLIHKHNWNSDLSSVYTNKAAIAIEKRDFKNAFEWLKTAKEWLNKIPNNQAEVFLLLNIGKAHFEEENYPLAIDFLLKTIDLAEENNRQEILYNAYAILSECYQKTENYKSAYIAGQKYQAIKDSIFSIESKRSLDEQQTLFEVKENEKQIIFLNGENEKKALKIQQTEQKYLYSIIVLLISLFGIFILIFAWRQKRNNNALLNKKNEIIKKSLNEKELLLREIHLRVKNNLQIITGLLELQESLHDDEKVGNLVS